MNRIAFWADEATQDKDGTFYVAGCVEGGAGFSVISPGWKYLEDAKTYAQELNDNKDNTPSDVINIRISSMLAGEVK